MIHQPLLQLRNLTREFNVSGGAVITAVDKVDLKIVAGESVAIVGESGSGKSTLGRLVLALIKPTAGSVSFDGKNLADLSAVSMRALRREMQVVFQNPHTSLHPRMTVAQSLAEPLRIQGGSHADAISAKVAEMVDIVGIPRAFLYRYPHELSGGQKQRICIARALMLRPKFIVLDEPTSALDVSVQAQILHFLKTMQLEWSLSYLFISHNLAVVEAMCNSILVMYKGQVLERGPVSEVINRPCHPYTRRLLQATLVATPEAEIPEVDDDIPNGLMFKGGCRYVQRCPAAIKDTCETVAPESILLKSGIEVRCHLYLPDVMHINGV